MFQTTLKRSTTSGDFAADSVAEKAISLAKFLRFALDSREPSANKPRGPIAQRESGRLRNDASGVRLPLGIRRALPERVERPSLFLVLWLGLR